jgi:hypothetical protein
MHELPTLEERKALGWWPWNLSPEERCAQQEEISRANGIVSLYTVLGISAPLSEKAALNHSIPQKPEEPINELIGTRTGTVHAASIGDRSDLALVAQRNRRPRRAKAVPGA